MHTTSYYWVKPISIHTRMLSPMSVEEKGNKNKKKYMNEGKRDLTSSSRLWRLLAGVGRSFGWQHQLEDVVEEDASPLEHVLRSRGYKHCDK